MDDGWRVRVVLYMLLVDCSPSVCHVCHGQMDADVRSRGVVARGALFSHALVMRRVTSDRYSSRCSVVCTRTHAMMRKELMDALVTTAMLF
jgi:hypothetical protein